MDKSEFGLDKVVIVSGSSFGSALQFMLLGAVLGAAGTYCALGRKNTVSAPETLNVDHSEARMTHRVIKLAKRLTVAAGHVKDVSQLVGSAVAPIVRNAVEEGKKAALKTRQDIENGLENEPDTVYATPSTPPEKP